MQAGGARLTVGLVPRRSNLLQFEGKHVTRRCIKTSQCATSPGPFASRFHRGFAAVHLTSSGNRAKGGGKRNGTRNAARRVEIAGEAKGHGLTRYRVTRRHDRHDHYVALPIPPCRCVNSSPSRATPAFGIRVYRIPGLPCLRWKSVSFGEN